MNKSLIIARKEFTDAVTSKRFWLIMGLFLLLYIAMIYATSYLFRIGGIPQSTRLMVRIGSSVASTVAFIAPMLGIALAFDAISGERERGTLRMLLARPIYREDVINGKIISALAVIAITITASSLISVSASILLQGIAVMLDDILRICLFIVLSILFSSAYYSVSLLISTFSRKSGYSLVVGMGVWIFFSFILPILASLIAFAIIGGPPVIPQGSLQPGQIPESYVNYARKLAEITNAIQMISINYHYSSVANSVFGFGTSPTGLEITQIDLLSLLSTHWIDILVVAIFPLIFSLASYMVFTRSEEK